MSLQTVRSLSGLPFFGQALATYSATVAAGLGEFVANGDRFKTVHCRLVVDENTNGAGAGETRFHVRASLNPRRCNDGHVGATFFFEHWSPEDVAQFVATLL